jgi:hypothetical protein
MPRKMKQKITILDDLEIEIKENGQLTDNNPTHDPPNNKHFKKGEIGDNQPEHPKMNGERVTYASDGAYIQTGDNTCGWYFINGKWYWICR